MSYETFAEFYDTFMSDVDYEKRANYVLSLFEKYDKKPTLLLDMACGTGSFTLEFLKNGIDVIGVDPSPEMLMCAREKTAEENASPLLLCQKCEDLDLYGTVDGAVCMLDSLNHITDWDELCRSISKISLFLEPQRLFIFDLNTEYKHKKVLSGQSFVYEDEKTDTLLMWRNSECENGLVDISLDFFVGEDGAYERFSEQFSERAYSGEQIEKALEMAGLEIVEIFEENTFDSPTPETERVIYVTRKK